MGTVGRGRTYECSTQGGIVKVQDLANAEADWLDFAEHIDQEGPEIQRWFRVDPYAVRTIYRAGFFDGQARGSSRDE